MKKYFLFFPMIGLLSCAEVSNDTSDSNILPGGGVEGVVADEILSDGNSENDTEWISKGDEITPDGAMTTDEMLEAFHAGGGFDGKIQTTVLSCCQKKGCWMKVDLGNGEEMRVTFKDYGFFVPKNSAGTDVIMQGLAYYDTVPVEMVKHYAEDAGKSQEEIDAITEPEVTIAFEATGVLLKKQ